MYVYVCMRTYLHVGLGKRCKAEPSLCKLVVRIAGESPLTALIKRAARAEGRKGRRGGAACLKGLYCFNQKQLWPV